MITNADSDSQQLKSRLWQQVRDPNRFRMATMGIMLLAGYCLVYMPLSDRIQETTQKLDDAKKSLALIHGIEGLQKQYRLVEGRLVMQTDPKEWLSYMLEGIRRFPLKLTNINCGGIRNVGPCRVMILHLDIECDFFTIDRFLRWLEADKRLFRVDLIRFAPRGPNKGLAIHMVVLGLMG